MPRPEPPDAIAVPAVPQRTCHAPTSVGIVAPAWLQSIADDEPIDVSVCIANWNCRDYLRGCLESLHDQPQGVRLETIVVDNGSGDGAADMVRREFPEVVLIRNQENRGFARASNQAAAVARGHTLFFLNNDTLVPAFTLKHLLDFARTHPEVGMIGPRLRDGDGNLQISYRGRPTIPAMLHRLLLLRWIGLFRHAYRRYRRSTFQAGSVCPVEMLMGAAVLIPRHVFEACGRWDEDYPFGGEDIDLSNRVGQTHPLIYLPEVEITHFGRISSRQNIEFATPNVLIGYVHYFRKSGASPIALTLYKLLVTLDTPLQLLSKLGQFCWRRLCRRAEQAHRSWLAILGLWHFLRLDLGRFWRA